MTGMNGGKQAIPLGALEIPDQVVGDPVDHMDRAGADVEDDVVAAKLVTVNNSVFLFL
jgi:hypothetical protein